MLFSLSGLDWVLVAIIVISSLISLKRGFFREALSLIIWMLAIIIAMVFSDPLAALLKPFVEPHITSPSLLKVVAIVLMFVMCLLVGGLCSLLLSQLIRLTGLTGTDRLLGTIFGALRGTLVVLVLLIVGQKLLPLSQEIWWQQSTLIPHFLRLEAWTVSTAIQLRDWLLPLVAGSSTTI